MRTPGPPKKPNSITVLAAFSVLAAGSLATPALAGHDCHKHDRHHADYYDSRASTDYAQVLSAEPIYRQVRVSAPRRECWDEQLTYREPAHAYGDNAAGAILGGIIGGVAGHQIGGGHGNDIATAVGAVVGAGLGSSVGGYDPGGYTRTGYETRCTTVDGTHYEQRVDGYEVTYRYNGRIYNTTLPYDPGNRLAVHVDVRPAAY